jgi:hypothetical protein
MAWPGLRPRGYEGPLTVVSMYLSSGAKLAAFRQDYSAPRQAVPGTSVAYSVARQ